MKKDNVIDLYISDAAYMRLIDNSLKKDRTCEMNDFDYAVRHVIQEYYNKGYYDAAMDLRDEQEDSMEAKKDIFVLGFIFGLFIMVLSVCAIIILMGAF